MPVKGVSVMLPDGNSIPVTHIGTIDFRCGLVLNHVLVIPNFKFNLLYVSRLIEHGAYSVLFHTSMCVFQDTKSSRTIGTTKLREGLFWFHSYVQPLSDKNTVSTCSSNFFYLWDFRLGHSSLDSLCKSLGSKNLNAFHCKVCPLAKQQRLKFPCSDSQATSVFDLIHVDIWGPYSVPSLDGRRFFLTIVDDCSHFTWVRLMNSKSEARKCLMDFCVMVSV
ncbi:Retrovirus-related Pol polyprotein from transposon RE2 [Linum perenne]